MSKKRIEEKEEDFGFEKKIREIRREGLDLMFFKFGCRLELFREF